MDKTIGTTSWETVKKLAKVKVPVKIYDELYMKTKYNLDNARVLAEVILDYIDNLEGYKAQGYVIENLISVDNCKLI